MITLYESGGSKEIDLVGQSMRQDVWNKLRNVAARYLTMRGDDQAADYLQKLPFEVWDGTNGFGDEFSVLYAQVPVGKYLELAEVKVDYEAQRPFRLIANALAQSAVPVRFIAASMDLDVETGIVSAPALLSTSETLERALAEVERALAAGLPAEGIDRVHTAFHAYLKELGGSIGLATRDAGLVELWKGLRQSHPGLQATGPRSADITRIMNSMATIADALNPLRNRASLAHPTDSLLEDAEAMLVINTVRTLLHYCEKRVRN